MPSNWDWKPDLYRIFIDRTAGDNTWSGFLWHIAERRGFLKQFADSRTGIIPNTRTILETNYEASLKDDQSFGDYRSNLLTAASAVEAFLDALKKQADKDADALQAKTMLVTDRLLDPGMPPIDFEVTSKKGE